MRRLALVLAGACGDAAPCDDIAGTCIALAVESATIAEIDHLELDVLYGDTHGTTTTQLPGGGAASLPLVTAIVLALDEAGPISVGVVGAGKLGASVLGTGAGSTELSRDDHATITLVLSPPADCEAGAYYCGGDKLAGDSQTLYQCNGGGVPLARGRCELGCIVRPTLDDACRGGGSCVEGSDYCGGDKLDGDPRTLYTCTGGVGTNPRECADGCIVQPGDDDRCR